jgi:hypothetical protein
MTTPKVHRITYTLRRPTGPNDPGAVEQGSYIIERGNTVVLSDHGGNPLKRERTRTLLCLGEPERPSRWERRLGPNEDAHRVARQLVREKYLADKKGRGQEPVDAVEKGLVKIAEQ